MLSTVPDFFLKLLKKIRLTYIVEIGIIVWLSLYATTQFANFDPDYHIGGLESENVTASAHYLDWALKHLGYIPQWQMLSNKGMPFMDEAYNFVLNPFNFLPVALYGDNNGIKVIVILHFALAGIGGWYLAQSLGMGTVGRMVLGALLVVKGNMTGTFGAGFLQLAIAQAYLPWVLAGALGMAHHPTKRAPPILTALSLALLWFCGTIYYILPAVLLVIFVLLIYGIRFDWNAMRLRVDLPLLRRFIVTGILTFGLMAVSVITIGLNFGLVGNHPDQNVLEGIKFSTLLYQIVEPDMLFSGLFAEFSYSYIAPLWFFALLFVFIPPIRAFHVGADRTKDGRLWAIGILGAGLFLAWGASLPPFPWMYANLPIISQWRYPERMLAVATFMIIFLLAYRIDGLYRALRVNINYRGRRTAIVAKFLVSVSVFVAAGLAIGEVYRNYYRWGYVYPEDRNLKSCTEWYIAHYPNEFLSIQKRDFASMASLLRNGVRMATIGAAYYVHGKPSTLTNLYMTDIPARYYMPAWDQTPPNLREAGYLPVVDSPPVSSEYLDTNCLWLDPDAPPYAFSVTYDYLQVADLPLLMDQLRGVTYLARIPEHIWLRAAPLPDKQTVVIAQDVAYPGWTVYVDGRAAQLESVGGVLGVVLPPGDAPVLVEFVYTATTFKIGGLITLVTAIGAVLYLLEAERYRARVASALRRLRSGILPPIRVPAPAIPTAPRILPRRAPTVTGVPYEAPQSTPAPLLSVEENAPNGVTAYVEGQAITPAVQVAAERTIIRIVVPPSNRPTHVEVAVPAAAPVPATSGGDKTTQRGLLALVGMAMAMLFWLANDRKPKR